MGLTFFKTGIYKDNLRSIVNFATGLAKIALV